jgi:predicted DNA-binding transcriptional regulator AlpA
MKLLTEVEVAEIYGVKKRTLQGWRLFRRGPRFRKIGRLVRYLDSDVVAWLQSRPAGGEIPKRKLP